MTKKFNIVTISLFRVIFLIGFSFSYKNYFKFRKSIQIALMSSIKTLSLLSVEAKSHWFSGKKGSTPTARSGSANENSGLFNQPKPQNQNPGDGN